MKRGDYAALLLFAVQAVCVFYHALYVPPVVPGLGDHYFNIPLSPLSEALSSIRTLGYPIFHALMAHYGWGLESYPTFHMMALLPCIFVFWWGLRAYGLTGLAALAAVSPLFYIVPVEVVMPETLAKCFAIASVGFLIWAAGTRRVVAYIGLAVSVFLAYQMRPAFLFLVGFLPVAWFFLYTRRWGIADQFKWLRNAAATAAACAAPLVLFCLFRLIIVGHFGLVSFGGQNTIGISVEMLSPATIEALPVQDRPLARLMHRARVAWPSERFITDRGVSADWDEITRQYVVNVNRIGRSVQAKFPAGGDASNVANDKVLSRMSLATFRAEADQFLAWLGGASIESARVAAELMLGGGGDFAFRWGQRVSLLLLALLAALALCSWPLERRAFGEGSRPHFARAATVVSFVAVLFFLLKMLLVNLVEPPIQRYVQTAVFLAPCALAALIWDRGVVFGAGVFRRPYWYSQCYATYPPVPDLTRPLPWRRWLLRAAEARRAWIVVAGALILVGTVVWWSAREDQFFSAMARGSESARAQLLSESPPVNWHDRRGATALHYAALNGDAGAVVHLLQSGADPEAATADGATALHWAAMGSGGTSVIEPLLGAGLATEQPGPLGMNPIHLASLSGKAPVLAALLYGGANPDLRTPGLVAPLHLADSVAVAEVLLRYGAGVDVRDGSDATPLMWAHTRELASYFLDRGADINAKENWRSFVRQCTPLHKAVYQEDMETARWLLERGADPNAGDINGLSPLFYALWRNNWPLAELLIDKGADPNLQGRWVAYHREDPGPRYTGIYGKTIGRHPKRDTFAALVPDKAGLHPLDFAAFMGNPGMIEFLLERGAKLSVHNEIGMSALHWATLGYRDHVIPVLRSRDPELVQLDDPRLPIAEFKQAVRDGERELTEAVRPSDPREDLHSALRKEADAYLNGAPNILEANGGFLFTRQACLSMLEEDYIYASPGEADSGPSPALASIRDIHRQLVERDIHLIVVPAPIALEVHTDAFYTNWDPAVTSHPALPEFVRELQASGVDAVDMLPAFQAYRAAHPDSELYLKEDGHWNSTAIGIAAEMVANRIRDLGLDLGLDTVKYRVEEAEHRAGLTHIARRLPESRQDAYRDAVWAVARVLEQSDSAYSDDGGSPVLVAGDSYTLMFNELAGHFSARLAAELGRPVASFLGNAAGPTIPRVLARKGKAYIDRRKVIVWVFSGSYIRPQGKDKWGPVTLP